MCAAISAFLLSSSACCSSTAPACCAQRRLLLAELSGARCDVGLQLLDPRRTRRDGGLLLAQPGLPCCNLGLEAGDFGLARGDLGGLVLDQRLARRDFGAFRLDLGLTRQDCRLTIGERGLALGERGRTIREARLACGLLRLPRGKGIAAPGELQLTRAQVVQQRLDLGHGILRRRLRFPGLELLLVGRELPTLSGQGRALPLQLLDRVGRPRAVALQGLPVASRAPAARASARRARPR